MNDSTVSHQTQPTPAQQSTSAGEPQHPKNTIHESFRTSTEQHYQLTRRIRNVAFFGFADAKPDTQLYQDAYKTAQLMAKQGLTIVDGGGPGVMDAATKGAQSVGGETLSVTFYPKDAPGFEGRYVGNVADTEIVTHNYIERMHKLMEHADIFIIFNGGTGTISEFGTAWVLARLYFGHHKPFILFGSFWRDILDVIEKNMMMRGNEEDVLRCVETPEEAFSAVWAFDEEMMSHMEHAIEKQQVKQEMADVAAGALGLASTVKE